jgi:uncharacterized surface protein with fasciclin (FAS1) repeats
VKFYSVLSLCLLWCVVVAADVAAAKDGRQVVDPRIEGSAMAPGKNIVQNVLYARELSTFAVGIRNTGLVHVLQEPGYFTVFAPLNDAFDDLSSESLVTLTRKHDVAKFRKILKYHVVKGKFSAVTLKRMMLERQGLVRLKTLQGGILMVTEQEDGRLVVTDEHYRSAYVKTADVYQTNGVMYTIDKVMLPQ